MDTSLLREIERQLLEVIDIITTAEKREDIDFAKQQLVAITTGISLISDAQEDNMEKENEEH